MHWITLVVIIFEVFTEFDLDSDLATTSHLIKLCSDATIALWKFEVKVLNHQINKIKPCEYPNSSSQPHCNKKSQSKILSHSIAISEKIL